MKAAPIYTPSGHLVYTRYDNPSLFDYNDGDDCETYILACIEQAKDLSSGSTELSLCIRDWPTRYHLSPQRCDLLRPFGSFMTGKKILEIGSGCGAITRFLCETGAYVTALEGSYRRARITAARCRDMDNVLVICDNFSQFESREQFDIITLVGVLEYSHLFNGGAHADKELLHKAACLLAPGGVLLVAIENKLGLKYFAGAPEDHTGKAYDGIENRYDGNTATTYGKAELETLLKSTGFTHTEFYYPFPDYKFPSVILREKSFQAPDLNIEHLILPAIHAMQGKAYFPSFSLERSVAGIVQNHLTDALSNSFLVVAGAGKTAVAARDILAYAFSSERKRAYRKQNNFVTDGHAITVQRSRMYPEATVDSSAPIVQHIMDEPYKKGQLHFAALTAITTKSGWDVNDIAAWASPYYQVLAGLSYSENGRDYLPGKYVDLTPSNIIVNGSDWQVFDQEWEVNGPVPLSFVLFRGLYYSLAKPAYWYPSAANTPLSAFALIKQVMGYLLPVPGDVVEDFISREEQYFGPISPLDHYEPADFRLQLLPETIMDGRDNQHPFSFYPLSSVTSKLFIETREQEFSEAGAVGKHFHLSPEKASYTLRVSNQPHRIQKIRIDPAEQTGALKLYSITVSDAAGNSLLRWSVDAPIPLSFNNLLAIPVTDSYLLVFLTDDPMILVDLSEVSDHAQGDWLEVRLEMATPQGPVTGLNKQTDALLSSMSILHEAAGPLLQEKPGQPADDVLMAYLSWLRQPFMDAFAESQQDYEEQLSALQGQLKTTTYQNQQLAADQETLKQHIDWYRRTYENRSLAGIIKTRMHQAASKAWRSLLNGLLSSRLIQRKFVATYLLEYTRTNGLRRSLASLNKTFKEHGTQTIFRARAISMASMNRKQYPVAPAGDPALATSFNADELRNEMKQWKTHPLISVIIPTYNTPAELLKKAIASVQNQVYEHWEICIGDDCSTAAPTKKLLQQLVANKKIRVKFHQEHVGISGASNGAITLAKGDWLALLDHDDELSPDALFEIAREINENSEADIIYTDECKIDEAGRLSEPFLKPGWSPELLINMMYTGHLTVYRRAFLEQKVGYFRPAYDFSQDYDLMLRASAHTEHIRHIPKVLYYWRITAGSATMGDKPYARVSNLAALGASMADRGIKTAIIELDIANRAKLIIDPYPKVSLIIPTDSFNNLSTTINSIIEGTDYPDYEIVAVTNSELIASMQEQVQDTRVRYVAYDLPYNFSDKCNAGALQARGELIVFFNDDVRPLQKDWLQHTIEFLYMPGVGAVSPKLVYEDNTIQYAGMVAGVRNLVGTSFHTWHSDARTYFNFPQLVRDVSILSGACLAMRKEVFEQVGGFDAVNTPSNHSDVDLSFKIREHGLRCVYTPYATLCHIGHLSLQEHEKKEKKQHKDRSDIYLLKRWATWLAGDPYFTAPMRKLLYHDSPEPYTIYAPTMQHPAGTRGNVLAVSHDLSLSGAPIMLYNSCLLMQEAGYFVQVVSPVDGPVRQMYQDAGIGVITDALVLRQHPSFYRFARNFDYLICNTAITWPVVAQLQDTVKTGWWIHEAGVLESLAAVEPGFVSTLQSANNLLTPGRYAAGYIEPYNSGVRTLYYGCADFSAGSLPLITNKEKIIVGIIGSIEYRKGQDIVIDALGYLPEELLSTMELWIVGRTHDPAFKAMLDTKTAGRSQVRYLGEASHEGCIAYMQQADIIINASRDDPFPVVLIEALCLGKTCILSSHTGTAELVQQGVNGFVFEQENSQELASLLAAILQNPSLLTGIGLQARITYQTQLTLEQFGQGWLHYLETLKTGRRLPYPSAKKRLIHEQAS